MRTRTESIQKNNLTQRDPPKCFCKKDFNKHFIFQWGAIASQLHLLWGLALFLKRDYFMTKNLNEWNQIYDIGFSRKDITKFANFIKRYDKKTFQEKKDFIKEYKWLIERITNWNPDFITWNKKDKNINKWILWIIILLITLMTSMFVYKEFIYEPIVPHEQTNIEKVDLILDKINNDSLN